VSVHAYLDESKRDAYVIVAALVSVGDVAVTRAAVRLQQLPGTRRVHFQTEGDAFRRKFIAALAQLPLGCRVYVAAGRRDLEARRTILARLVPDLVQLGGSRLVLERDDSLVVHDERAIKQARSTAGAADTLRFDHLRGPEEPLLWVPDAVAWAWCRDKAWRTAVAPLISDVIEV